MCCSFTSGDARISTGVPYDVNGTSFCCCLTSEEAGAKYWLLDCCTGEPYDVDGTTTCCCCCLVEEAEYALLGFCTC